LLPKEHSLFRLEFEDTAWLDPDSQKPAIFNPQLSVASQLTDVPHHFEIHLATATTNVTPYHSIAVSEIKSTAEEITGTLYNAGNQEVTIPQLLVGYYDESASLIWVDHQFLRSNVRQQRKVPFEYELIDHQEIKMIAQRSELIYCNGQQQISEELMPIKPSVSIDSTDLRLLLDVNNFIGNPQ
jgi:hypothetical protein